MIKIFTQHIISTHNSKFTTEDIKDFYIHSDLPTPEYMFLPSNIIPTIIMKHYKLQNIIFNKKIYIKTNKGMYGLPQDGKLDHTKLCKLLTHKKFPHHL